MPEVFGHDVLLAGGVPLESEVQQHRLRALACLARLLIGHQPLQVQLADDAARVSLEAEMHAARHLEALPGRFPQRGRHLEALADPVPAAASPGGKDLASAARSPGACRRSASFSESSSRRDVSSGMTMRSETATAASPWVDAVRATRPNSTTMSPASSDTLNASAAVSSTDSSQRSIG